MSRQIAIIAAHPDDEVLGCGATMAWHVSKGDAVHVLILGEGATSRAAARDVPASNDQLTALASSARKANEILGVSSLKMLGFPDNRMDSGDLLDVVKAVESFIEQCQPQAIYTHWPFDLNIDHCVVSEAVQTACRPTPQARQDALLFFEVPSSTGWRLEPSKSFEPNYFVDVSSTLELKQRALAAYSAEMRAWPHARSHEAIVSLARWRGASVGMEAAEAFVLARSLAR